MKTVAGAIFLLVATVAGNAYSVDYTVFGATDCGKWVNAKTEARKGWLMGFMSGMNRAYMELEPGSPDPLDTLSSADQMFLWMDNYCRANPLSSVDRAAYDLFIELIQRAGPSRKP